MTCTCNVHMHIFAGRDHERAHHHPRGDGAGYLRHPGPAERPGLVLPARGGERLNQMARTRRPPLLPASLSSYHQKGAADCPWFMFGAADEWPFVSIGWLEGRLRRGWRAVLILVGD